MNKEKKPVVVMTAAGRAKELSAGASMREVLETVQNEHVRAGSDYDRPTRLFVGGECVVEEGLADIAWEFSEFQDQKYEEVDAALEAWIKRRFGKPQGSEAA